MPASQTQLLAGSAQDSAPARSLLAILDTPAVRAGWVVSLVVGAYLRWSHVGLSEFGADQQVALHFARLLRRGWELPLVGNASSIGPHFGPGEYYVMLPPQLVSAAPEVSIVYIGLLGLTAAAWFAVVVGRHFGRWTGLISLALFACGPWAVYFTRKIWTPDSLPLFSAAAFHFLLLGLVAQRWWGFLAAAFALGFAVQVHPSVVSLLPAFALLLLIFWRRLKAWQVVLSAVAFVIPASLYIAYLLRHGPAQLVNLQGAYSQPSQLDLSSFDVFQTLITGAAYIEGLGASYPPEVVVPDLPGAVWLLGLALWGGIGLMALDLARAKRRPGLSPPDVARTVALVWVLVPLIVNIRHPLQLFLRYELYLLPIGFLFPAYFFASLPSKIQWLVGRWSASRGTELRRVSAFVCIALVVFCALRGVVRVEAVYRSLESAEFPLLHGTYDARSVPVLRDSQAALARIEELVGADHETILVSRWFQLARPPLEYLVDHRYRLRYNDVRSAFVLPWGKKARLVFLAESGTGADVLQRFGGRERTDSSVVWPPNDEAARVVDVEFPVLPNDLILVAPGQVLPNGLELRGYAVSAPADDGTDILTVWRLARPDWATKHFHMYNAFIHVIAGSGERAAAGLEAELPNAAQWREGDLMVIPFHIDAQLVRGLYGLEVGVYVRAPARAPLPLEGGAVPVARVDRVRLGRPLYAAQPASGPVVEFGPSIRLIGSTVRVSGRQVEISLIWQATGTVQADYTVFTHVYDGSGRLVAQSDGWPSGGNYPTSAWLPGEYVSDRRTILLPGIPSAQPFTVKVGLYDAETLERLPANPRSLDRAVAIGEFTLPMH
mgnify:CR=1 FL=1